MFGLAEIKLLLVVVLAYLSYRAAKKTRQNLLHQHGEQKKCIQLDGQKVDRQFADALRVEQPQIQHQLREAVGQFIKLSDPCLNNQPYSSPLTIVSPESKGNDERIQSNMAYQKCIAGKCMTDQTLLNGVVLYNDAAFEEEFFEGRTQLIGNEQQYDLIEGKMSKYVLFEERMEEEEGRQLKMDQTADLNSLSETPIRLGKSQAGASSPKSKGKNKSQYQGQSPKKLKRIYKREKKSNKQHKQHKQLKKHREYEQDSMSEQENDYLCNLNQQIEETRRQLKILIKLKKKSIK